MTITDEKYFREHSDVVQVAAYALHDVLHALKNDNCECLVSKEDGHLVVHYCKKRSVSTDAKSSACNDGNIEQDPSISRQQFDSLVSSILSKFPNASLSEFNGQSVIKYHGREFDLKNTYFLTKHPHFVRLLEQDMRTLDNYDYVVNHNIGESMIDLHDWNDVSNTKIPLNKEIFALLEDRMDSEKLRPEVIIAKMMPAKRLTWTEKKDGDVLCYDVPSGNFHSCNGAQIKYWKHVNVPVRTRQGNIENVRLLEEMPSISKKEFDSLVSGVLEEFPDASLSECDGHPVINYRGRQFDLENTYFLSKRPDFVRLLEQDMRSFNEYLRAIKDQK